MTKYIAVCFVALAMSGCASNSGLRSQVDALTERAHSQDAQIADLKDKLAKTKETSVSATESAWDWTKEHAEAAWNSDMSVEARNRLRKCWADLRNEH